MKWFEVRVRWFVCCLTVGVWNLNNIEPKVTYIIECYQLYFVLVCVQAQGDYPPLHLGAQAGIHCCFDLLICSIDLKACCLDFLIWKAKMQVMLPAKFHKDYCPCYVYLLLVAVIINVPAIRLLINVPVIL